MTQFASAVAAVRTTAWNVAWAPVAWIPLIATTWLLMTVRLRTVPVFPRATGDDR